MALPEIIGDTPPLPAELMDAPDTDVAQLAIDADLLAESQCVPLPEVVRVLADSGPGRWRIENDDQAEWAMRKLAAATAAVGELRRKADAWHRQITEWLADAERGDQRDALFFMAHLEWYGERVRLASEADPDAETVKSVRLPSGQIKTRHENAAIVVEDADALLAWANDYLPSIVKITETVPVADLRKVAEISDDYDDGVRRVVVRRVDDAEQPYHLPVPGAAVREESLAVNVEVR